MHIKVRGGDMRWPRVVYDGLVVLHVVSVAVALGAIALTGGYARNAVAHQERTSEAARWFAPPRGIRWARLAFWSVPVLGIALTIGNDDYDFGQVWVWASLVSWVAAAAITQRIVWPGHDAITDAFELRRMSWSKASADPILARTAVRVSRAAAVVDVLFVVALVLMLTKAGLPR